MTEPRPIVLLHGFAGSTRRTWAEAGWLDLIGDSGRPVLGIDLLGHGTADHPTDADAYDALESTVLAQLPADPVDVIAFSAGGRVALQLAATQPGRFNRLVVAGLGENVFREAAAASDAAAQERTGGNDVLADALAAGETDGHPFMRWLARESAEADLDHDALIAFLRRPNPPPLGAAELALVQAPVLLVMGDQDWAGPAEPLAAALPDATVVGLRGVDHFATPRSMGFMDAAFDFLGIEF